MSDFLQTLPLTFTQKRAELTLLQKISACFAMALLTGILAQIQIPLPFTPVPITGQTFAVLLAGMVLGKNWGGLSQIIYIVLGVFGMPWFSQSSSGLAILLGPSGGYLIGFALSAFVLGYIYDTFGRPKSFVAVFALILASNLFLIFAPGLIQLYIWTKSVTGQTPSLLTLFTLGYFPFIIGDLIKAGLAALVARGLVAHKEFLI